MHGRGRFAVAAVTSTFVRMVKIEARAFGIPGMPILEAPHHPGAVTPEEASADAQALVPALVALLRGEPEAPR